MPFPWYSNNKIIRFSGGNRTHNLLACVPLQFKYFCYHLFKKKKMTARKGILLPLVYFRSVHINPKRTALCFSLHEHLNSLFQTVKICTLLKVESNSPWVNFINFLDKKHLLSVELIFISSNWRVYMYLKFDI